jgi:phosphohistidine phosphatase
MKRLTLIRHAKSSWNEPNMEDFDRPLNKRGMRDAPLMGTKLGDLAGVPDLFISSPAVRARSTAEAIADGLDLGKEKLVFDKRLYLPSWHSFIEVVKSLEEGLQAVYLCSHNPGSTDFVNRLCDVRIDNIPTCGFVCMELNIDCWDRVTSGCGSMLLFEYPKKFK